MEHLYSLKVFKTAVILLTAQVEARQNTFPCLDTSGWHSEPLGPLWFY
jgi:hypothetical protein